MALGVTLTKGEKDFEIHWFGGGEVFSHVNRKIIPQVQTGIDNQINDSKDGRKRKKVLRKKRQKLILFCTNTKISLGEVMNDSSWDLERE